MSSKQTKMRQDHWEQIYRTKGKEELSWHQDDPSRSLQLIQDVLKPGQAVIDIGGGSSVLVGRLLEAGVDQVAVLDISEAALQRAKTRIGDGADRIYWIVADVTQAEDIGRFDIWHDRAVFHFLTDPQDRERYIALADRTIPMGGYLILSTFSPEGPEKCSGLPVQRYDAYQLSEQFAKNFKLVTHAFETHETPWGRPQPFVYVVLKKQA